MAKTWISLLCKGAPPLKPSILKFTYNVPSSHLSLGHFPELGPELHCNKPRGPQVHHSLIPCHTHNPSPFLDSLSSTPCKAHPMAPDTLKSPASINFPSDLLSFFTRGNWLGRGPMWFMLCILDAYTASPGTRKVIMWKVNLGFFRKPGRFPINPLGTSPTTCSYLRITGTPGSISQMHSTHSSGQWHELQTFRSQWQMEQGLHKVGRLAGQVGLCPWGPGEPQ